jgi:CheY-like chemotaxis protein
MHGDAEKCFKAGMDDYISKPFNLECLIQKVKKYQRVDDNEV